MSPQTARDTQLKVKTLRELGWTYTKISKHLNITYCQVQLAATLPLTPKRKSGRPPLLDTSKRQELVSFVISSQEARQMPYLEIPISLEWEISEDTIRRALIKKGFH
jgi:transposase